MLVIQSEFSQASIRSALDRGAFLLRQQGNGPYDNNVATILESIKFPPPPTGERLEQFKGAKTL